MEERQKLLDKIEALLQMTAKNGCTEAEAAAAAHKAEFLMEKYGLSLSDLRAASPTDVCSSEYVKVGRRKTHEAQYCCNSIAIFTDTRIWAETKAGEVLIRFFGLINDVSIASYLFQTFRASMDYEWAKYWKFNSQFTPMHGRKVRKSFMLGMSQRLNERVYSIHETRKRQFREENKALVLLKTDTVNIALNNLKLRFEQKKIDGSIADITAYRFGQAAGDRVGINQGTLHD